MREPDKYYRPSGVKSLFALRQNNWKLMDGAPENNKNGTWLFDLSNDPGEINNLAEKYPDIVDRYL